MTRMPVYLIAAAVCLMLVGSAAGAEPLVGNPLHNYSNPVDVDGSTYVSPRDLLLVINKLQAPPVDPLTAQLESSNEYYWDTSNNGFVTPNDALLVINHLLRNPTTVPEPGSIVTCGLALVGLAGICWRKRRRGRS